MLTVVLNYLYPVLSLVISGTVIPYIVKFIIVHTKNLNLEKNMKLGKLVWDAIEEDERLGNLGDTKLTTFMNTMKVRTKLSDADILLINKAIGGIINVGKEVIEQIEEVTPVSEVPVA
ncbi:hypothetical protein [Clostridium sp.]|mgnify:CR=1 FL=1|uniref:hypothetical protein n=1 Tax=Clostridium sp. TaxID=1506 RepID=UPI002613BE53|nr:hypothetical protein [uncultured Clostridium sp.]